jgi:hypothetical protein
MGASLAILAFRALDDHPSVLSFPPELYVGLRTDCRRGDPARWSCWRPRIAHRKGALATVLPRH